MSAKIPRDKVQDNTESMATTRRDFVEQQTGVRVEHVAHYSLQPESTRGNIEHFTGVAQVPMGLAGPLLVNGEHAQGDFYVPLATTEGTLVASYNRGMRLLRDAGGVTVSVVDDAMQRAPVFVFDDARQARAFGTWVEQNLDAIREVAEATTSSGKLLRIEQYAAACLRYLRFNFSTGDAAGQNMVGRATFAACEWIMKNYPGIRRYMLSGSMDTDKKHSLLNTLHSRGKRVIAEAVIPDRLLREQMGVSAELLFRSRQISNTGSFMAGAVNNGSHSANGITALFIATGQDVANVAESSAAVVYATLTPEGDYYFSITLPSLIVATHGGGTGLATQRECLQLMGCEGKGKVNKLAEIIGATVLCGELSLGSAVIAGDWVTSHEQYGRNR
ncbi:hydroxymethylglutaryl-CoA reductase [Aestuariirhabdus litorea]|uniref:hydroxymethylglutaryl-CoA reductase (NADPH) n=1 Tax=Aestuariirhabdus litorea TaxID=2528527 RepID=A0A3P3VN16_9GAMM|nr:hydroxymethylglutaryl-CoA reductase [Aestuariirhabdus litorea]RRJ84085.1 hydroxymethylglutaryl-CoA reductase [Aestuariirhabdus litorea]RWW97305.1 hydroxymethylglutaryl-CoA reductase [Endozoicomonadaceae bacterium GTF-13]